MIGTLLPRTIELFNNVEDCAHGTTVTGMIAGPVNNDYAITGVAHRASIKSYKAGKGVVLDTPIEKADLIDGLEAFSLASDVRVINISLGYLFYKETIWDALVVAETAGKLVVCAAGSVLGVGVYPARHSNTVAVTGVKYDPIGDPSAKNLDVYAGNNTGSFVDFCTYLERYSDGRLALGMHKDTQDRIKAEGSSAAAALVSGIAALIWQQNSALSRNGVINILKNSASIYHPFGSRDSNYGWGVVDAERALMLAEYGFLSASISGSSYVNTTGITYWTANVENSGGYINYTWYWNGVPVGFNKTYGRNFMIINEQVTESLKLVVTTSVGQEDETYKKVYVGYGKGGGDEIE